MVRPETEAALAKEENLWESLLRRVGKGANTLQNGTVVIMGDTSSGKRTLANKLLQAEARARVSRADSVSHHGLQDPADILRSRGVSMASIGYTYLDPPVDPEPPLKLDVWILQNTEQREKSLEIAIPNVEALYKTALILVVDLSRPWDIMKSLQTWYGTLKLHLESIPGSDSAVEEIRVRMAHYLAAVRQAGGDQSKFDAQYTVEEANEINPLETKPETDNTSSPEQLPKGSLGIPIMVVGCKSDVVREASDDVETEMRLEFIQRSLRKFCYEVGASLTYVSSRSEASFLSLLQYVVHVLYPQAPALIKNAELDDTAAFGPLSLVSRRDVVHIPAGADHRELINALASTKHGSIVQWSAEDPYEQVILTPASLTSGDVANPSSELMPTDEDDQGVLAHPSFLAKLLAKQKLLPESVRVSHTDAASSALEAFNETAASFKTGMVSSNTPSKRTSAVGVVDTSTNSQGNDSEPSSARRVTAQDAKENPALIANFFQNLLNRDKDKDSS
mmetsp:Transcript_24955/g.39919  ORF Transcript_24955/g.39919 Transcript_24955/m.39919 type:complete len:507 (-) Transcript_24955:25-1545(-)|eukprot:CAMPEP_0171544216 /NCGR_PEP_ID=MMETSP0960-20121227/3376_1 /TAXON_ID=87120 /ORGANISM="Aurantiochytrium limacinum, Strain ATCCMYA-1381" /LENGTH=506 /DNA_ID=CAMNT_0012091997 /DNA_START=1 /DNA_END=1521 /DNA_ORIENTATION=-